VGRIPGGATVERAVPTALGQGDFVMLTLNTADFTTASRLTDAINMDFGGSKAIAMALDGRAIRVRAPQGPERVAFMSRLENLQIEPAHAAARVIINARTGSIVMNQQVTLETCSISHGNMMVVVKQEAEQDKVLKVSKAEDGKPADTDAKKTAAVLPEIKSEPGNLMMLPRAVTLNEVIRALNAIGATPRDLLAILQAMKASGALRAELEII
jgi:flagellar P-ring protein precursor FlgI